MSRLFLSVLLLQLLHVDHWEHIAACRMDHLHWVPSSFLKGRAQAFVPTHQHLETLLQGLDVEIPQQTQCSGNEVGDVVWLQLVQEPQALLRKGEGDLLWTCHGHQRRDLSPLVLAQRLLYPLRQGCHGWGLKYRSYWHLYTEHRSEPCNELHRQQGVSSQFKEMVVDPHLLAPQHLAPQFYEQVLDRCPGTL